MAVGKKKATFLISPIGSKDSPERRFFDKVKRHLIDPVCEAYEYNCKRADELPHPGTITTAIIEKLKESDLVIADLTYLNPNVFYELAIRHAINKPVILIAQEGTNIPFDVTTERVVFYTLDPDDLKNAKERLTELVKTVDTKGYENESPLKSKIQIESTKTVGEQELLIKIYEKLQDISRTKPEHTVEIEQLYPKQIDFSDDVKKSLTIRLLDIIGREAPITIGTLHNEFTNISTNSIKANLANMQHLGLIVNSPDGFVITNAGKSYLHHYL
jgi:hypothetical protein